MWAEVGYVTPAFSGEVPCLNTGEQNQNWLPQPCLRGGQHRGAMSPCILRGAQ